MSFPHLPESTDFPWNENPPAPYAQYRNTFDYTQWEAGTTLTLLNVPWDADTNVIGWQSDAARDKWFEDNAGAAVTLTTAVRITGGTVNVPLPYNVAAAYNYAWVTYGSAPVANESDDGIRHWGFFMRGCEWRAPSTTALILELDTWTVYRDRVNVKSVQLEQGHWAVANSATPAVYCADPLDNTAYLEDAENDSYTPGRSTLIAHSEWNTGELMAVLDMGATNPTGSYAGATPTTTRVTIGTGQPTGALYALNASNLQSFIAKASPGLIQGIRALWLIPRRFLALGTGVTAYDTTLYPVTATTSESTGITLTPAAFPYPASVQGFTKLYTGQYATLQVKRSDGTMVSVPTDRLTSGAAHRAALVIDQTGARIITYLNGLAGSGTEAYSVQTLSGATNPGITGDMLETLHGMPFPSYSVNVSAADLTAWSKNYERAQARANAETAYQNALASNATAQSNANASADTAKANADASADTGKTNADASADTGKTNADASADTAKANTTRSTNNTVTNNELSLAMVKATQEVNNAYAAQTTTQNLETQAALLGVTCTNDELHGGGTGTYDNDLKGSTLNALSQNAQLDWEYNSAQYTNALQNMTNPMAFAVQAMNGGAGAIGSAMKADAAGNSPIQAAATGAIGSVVNLAVNTAAMNVTISNNETLHGLSRTYQVGDGVAYFFGGKTGVIYTADLYQNQQNRKNAWGLMTESRAVSRALTDAEISYQGIDVPNGGQIGTSRTQTANDKSTTDSNATANQTTAKANATRSRATAKANATRTRDTTKSNAAATQSTAKANAQRTKDTGDANAKRTYDNALAQITAGINTDNRQAPLSFGTSTDTGSWTKTPQGVQYRLVTPTAGDALRIGQRFNRYGYRCAATISAPNLVQMPKWSYWKCASAWVVPSGAPADAVESVRRMLTSGVTVWRAPEMIGDTEQ